MGVVAKARLFVDADLSDRGGVMLGRDQARYLGQVMRLGPDDGVSLFNGRDGEWLARVVSLGRNAGALDMVERTRPQAPEPDLWLAFAPVKKTGTDFIVEKATELGASRLLPVLTRRTNVARVKTDRLRANAIEAAEQCERLTVPEVAEPVSLDRLLDAWPADRPLVVADERGGGVPVAKALAALADDGVPPHGLLIGPEGGFEAAELDRLAALPFAVRVGLGPRILRAETAAVALLACWQAILGDWADRPPPRA